MFRPYLLAGLCIALTGCAVGPAASPIADPGVSIRGKAFGGQQPVVGAQVYLYAANTTGTAGPGIAPSSTNQSVSLLNSGVLTNNPSASGQDASGNYYVLTAADGSFSIGGDYACTPNQQVYILVTGGNPGAGTNSASSMTGILGNCPAAGNFAAAVPYVWINEVSTVAAAYSLAPFASDATHVSTSGSTQATTGIANAFLNAPKLADISAGTAVTTTANGGSVPNSLINTIADILAACVNSSDLAHNNCDTLFENATTDGVATTSTGGATNPTDVASAAINIVHNPGANVASLYGLQPATGAPFFPNATSAPPSFLVAIRYAEGCTSCYGAAADASGNIWFVSLTGNKLYQIDHTGKSLGSYTTNLSTPQYLAVDASGNIWVTNSGNGNVTEYSASGTALGTYNPTNSGLSGPQMIAFDATGNAWIANSNTKVATVLSSTGAFVGKYTPTASQSLYAVAIDTSGNAWLPGYTTASAITKLSGAGTQLGSYTPASSNLNYSRGAAFDGTGNLWIPNYGDNYLTVLSSSGALVGSYTTTGMATPITAAIDGSQRVWVGEYGANQVALFSNSGATLATTSTTVGSFTMSRQILVDNSGSVWLSSSNNTPSNYLTEFPGQATPVVTPLVANLKAPYGASAINRP